MNLLAIWPGRHRVRKRAWAVATAGVLTAAVSVIAVLAARQGTCSAPHGPARGQGIAAHPAAWNVRVSNDAFPHHAEPSVAADPADASNLLASAELIGRGQPRIGTFYSGDGGKTWHSNGPLPGASTGFNATVAFGPGGDGFVVAGSLSGVSVWRTLDTGRSFAAPVTIPGSGDADHPWVSAGLAGVVYVVWKSDAGIAFSQSLDHGKTFSAGRVITGPASIPDMATGPDGTIYVCYITAGQHAASAANFLAVAVISSRDHGATFGRPVIVASVPGALTAPSHVPLPWGPVLAADASGTVTVAYTSYQSGAQTAGLWIRQSTDHGQRWTIPLRVTSAPRADTVYLQSALAAAPGTAALSYYAITGGNAHLLVGYIRNGRVSAVPVSARSFAPPVTGAGKAALGGSNPRAWFLGDYQGEAITPGTLHVLWSDGGTGRLQIEAAALPLASTATAQRERS